MEEGAAQSRRNDLVDGSLRRSQGIAADGVRLESFDDRILCSGEFVDCLRIDKKLHDKLAKSIPLDTLLERVAQFFGLEPGSLKRGRRMAQIVEARGAACYFAVRELEYSWVTVGEALNMKRSGSMSCRKAR